MATLTNEQIEQKMKLLTEKLNEIKVISDELKDSGNIELSDEELEGVSGGDIFDWLGRVRDAATSWIPVWGSIPWSLCEKRKKEIDF